MAVAVEDLRLGTPLESPGCHTTVNRPGRRPGSKRRVPADRPQQRIEDQRDDRNARPDASNKRQRQQEAKQRQTGDGLRDAFDLTGTPIIMKFRKKD